MNKKEPKFRNLKFEKEELFQDWLSQHEFMKIEFADKGQDLLSITIDEEGEVIDANAQESVWLGCFVDTTKIRSGKGIYMQSNFSSEFVQYDFIISNYSKTKKTKNYVKKIQ